MAAVLAIEGNKKLADLFASDLMLAGFRVKTAVGYRQLTPQPKGVGL